MYNSVDDEASFVMKKLSKLLLLLATTCVFIAYVNVVTPRIDQTWRIALFFVLAWLLIFQVMGVGLGFLQQDQSARKVAIRAATVAFAVVYMLASASLQALTSPTFGLIIIVSAAVLFLFERFKL